MPPSPSGRFAFAAHGLSCSTACSPAAMFTPAAAWVAFGACWEVTECSPFAGSRAAQRVLGTVPGRQHRLSIAGDTLRPEPLEQVLADHVLVRQLDRILPVEARHAQPGAWLLGGGHEVVQGDVAQRVCAD